MFITGKIKFFLKNIDFIRKSNIFPVNFVVVSKKNNLINYFLHGILLPNLTVWYYLQHYPVPLSFFAIMKERHKYQHVYIVYAPSNLLEKENPLKYEELCRL